MKKVIVTTLLALFVSQANALAISDLSNTDASNGLKAALIQGANKAVANLGAVDGFFGNKQVKIPLPETMQKAEKAMRMFGMGKQADELVLKMNRAAEAAVPEAKALLIDSVKKMTLDDAKAILTGPPDSATQYFKKTTSLPMGEKFYRLLKAQPKK